MAVGLGNAFGIQAGYEALHDIIARRKKDEILAQKMEADRQEKELQLAQFEEQKRQFGITNQRLEEAAGIVQQRQHEQDLVNKAGRIASSSAIGDPLSVDKAGALIQAGEGNAVAPTPIQVQREQPVLPGVGIIEKIGARPTLGAGSDTGGGFMYSGTSQQVHQAEADKRAEEARVEAAARDERNAKHQQFSEDASTRAYNLAVQNANRPMPLVMIGNDGQPHVVGEAAKGLRIVQDPNKLLASDAQMKNAAKQVIPHIQEIRNLADTLNQRGLIGPVASRWTDFMAGKIKSGELAAGDAEGARILGEFRSKLKLLQSASARAHAGARGAGSESLLKAMNDVISGGADMPTFMGSLDGLQSFMEGYAQLGEPEHAMPAPSSEAARPGAGLKGSTDTPAAGGGSAPTRVRYDANGNRIP